MTAPAAVRRAPDWLIALGNRVFKTRDILFPATLLVLVVLSQPSLSRWTGIAGVLIALAGQLLRIVVIGYKYIIRGGRNKQVYAEGLVTTGVFALSRNPLYVGNLMVFLGLIVTWSSPLVYAVGIPVFLLAYRAIVAAEEDYLGRQYGPEFDAYCDRVPRWWPRLSGLAEATRDIPFNWRRVILKEYGSTAAWSGTALAMLAYKEQLHANAASRPAQLAPYFIGGVLVAAFWGYARFLKKTGRLRENPAYSER